jgi:DNA-binding response OmpR family regulator
VENLDEVTESFRQSLDAEGGVLWFEALDAGGIQAWIALPLQPESQHAADVTRIRETVDTRLRESAEQSTKVLVQAENDPLRGMLAENLIEGGYDVVSVKQSEDVLPLARREIPDLIVLDLQSRDPSAMDLALLLRGEPKLSNAPILFLTEVVGSGIGTRMDTVDFLVQPEGAHALLETVNQVLGSGLRPAARIMVVEEDDTLREEMLQTIQSQGYPVVEARSAEEAFALAERVNLGVVLANAGLAQARDYWLVRQLRQLTEGIDIYLMTEGPPSIDPGLALHKGVKGYGETGRLRELLARVDEEDERQIEED